MKKYQQLLLLILSILSISLLLVYRHQYNRLHYVLEVFNFFGQPCNVTDLESGGVLKQPDWGPLPFWRYGDTFQSYSAFYAEGDDIKVIVLSRYDAVLRDCYLWYENEKKPKIGKYKYSKIYEDKIGNVSLYTFMCNGKDLKMPYAVSFTTKRKRSLSKILVRPLNRKILFNTTACVPPTNIFDKSEFLEFLSFHSLIGIDSYLFYTDNIPYRLQKIIINFSLKLNINITFLPWNDDNINSNLTVKVIENDCLLRALPNSNNIIVLNMNDYLVPSMYLSYNNIFKIIENRKTNPTRIILPIQTFCIENTGPKKPIALQNTDVIEDLANNLTRDIVRNVNTSSINHIEFLNSDVASIHRYTYCNSGKITHSNNVLMKYSTDFLRSTLMQLYYHGYI